MVGLANKVRPYKNTDGTTSMLPLRDIMINVFKAYFIQIFHPLSATIPLHSHCIPTYLLHLYNNTFLLTSTPKILSALLPQNSTQPTFSMKQVADLNIVNPFKRDHENYLTFMEGIKELYRNCKDETSICKQILKNQKLTESEKIFDLNTFIFAGAETSSHGIVSTLFFMKKYPESFEKLRKEIQDAGISKETLFSEGLTREKIEELDYLTCVVKEGLRIDGPGAESFVYAASQDVELCGVPIPKGFPIKVDLATGHYNEDYWKDPHDFVPERYDDESEFYKQAEKEGKFGLGFSTRPFSHGFRACPGQSFALLEMKVAIIVILTLIDYEVDPELFQKEGVGFGVGGSIPASFKINWR